MYFFSAIILESSSWLIFKSFNALDNNASIIFNLLFANTIILLCFFFSFLVNFNNDLFMPVLIANIKVKEAPAIPAGIRTTVACETILNVPNVAGKVINILSK